MTVPPSDATILVQEADPDPDRPARASRFRRWPRALDWPPFRRPGRTFSLFTAKLGDASRREEVHDLLVRAAREAAGAVRVELRAAGVPRRVLVSRTGRHSPIGDGTRLPLRYRGEELATLIVWTRDGRPLKASTRSALESLCAVAAIADRMLGREPMLRLAPDPRPEADPRARALLLPFLRQLVLLARRRREPLTVMAIGLDRPVEPRGEILRRDAEPTGDPVIAAVLGAIRESDLVVQDDPRTLIAVLPSASVANAPLIAEAVARAADETMGLTEPPPLFVGVSCFPDDASEADVLIDVALEALRRARLSADHRVVIADRAACVPRVVPEDGEHVIA